MKSVVVVLVVLGLLVASISSADDPKCHCEPAAGCREIGCRCWSDGIELQPPRHPEQLLQPGCPICPPILHCPADLVRLGCSENTPCSAEELKVYVPV